VWYKCSVVQVWYKCGTSVVQVWYKCGTSVVQVWYKCGTSVVQVWYKCAVWCLQHDAGSDYIIFKHLRVSLLGSGHKVATYTAGHCRPPLTDA
jgi:hypothetical protein